ncbi:MAG: hypothetical protein IJH00_03595 [Erysipelotrichaceae bacterium]|nr:hypothetical protein [Erysipelotrichaceae bacterium]MBQ6493199.1 hypothetical protein [Erysipelotrichaceae bacterium]
MEILSNYSGITALIVYGIILALILSLRKKKTTDEDTTEEVKERLPLDLNDEDATVACLVAAIDCREECHRNVQIVSVRRIA